VFFLRSDVEPLLLVTSNPEPRAAILETKNARTKEPPGTSRF
jgi:hypothetical protein